MMERLLLRLKWVVPLFIANTGAIAAEFPASMAQQKEILFSLESISQRAGALGKTSAISVIDSPFMPKKFDLAGSGNTGRTMRLLSQAQQHLLLGDPARAESLITAELANINEFSPKNSTDFLRTLYESRRIQGKFIEAADTCQTYLAQGGNDTDLVLSCAHTMTKVTVRSAIGVEPISESKLAAFAYARAVRDAKSYKLPIAILMVNAFRNLNKPQEAMDYIERSLSEVATNDPWYARGQLALAICRIQNGWREKALRALRKLVEPQRNDDIFPPGANPDRNTQSLAHVALGRVLMADGYVTDAKIHYERALLLTPRQDESRQATGSPLGSFPDAKEQTLSPLHAGGVPASQIRQEARSLFCTFGLNAPCPPLFTKVSDETIFSLPEESLRRSFLSRVSNETLAFLLGKVDADLEFLRTRQKIERRFSREHLEMEIHSLSAIASYYRHDSDALLGLQSAILNSVTARKNADQMGRQLSTALAPVLDGYLGSEPGYRESVQRFADLLSEANRQLTLLDSISRKNWNAESTVLATADEHRTTLQKIIQDINEPSAHVSQKHGRNRVPSPLPALTRELTELHRALGVSTAKLGAARFLATTQSPEKPDEQKRKSLLKMQLKINELSQQIMERELRIRTALLNEQNPRTAGVLLLERMDKTRKSVKTYFEVHLRLLEAGETGASAQTRKTVLSLWERLLETYDNIWEGASIAEEKNSAESRAIAQETQQALRKKLDLEIDAIKMGDRLLEQAQGLLPTALAKLAQAVATTRDEIRLMLALQERQKMVDTKRQQEATTKAMEERKHWIETLNESLKWETGR